MLEQIQKLHKSFMASEKRLKNSNKAVEDSMDTRQEVKHKLSTCSTKGFPAALERNVKELSVVNLNKKVSICRELSNILSECKVLAHVELNWLTLWLYFNQKPRGKPLFSYISYRVRKLHNNSLPENTIVNDTCWCFKKLLIIRFSTEGLSYPLKSYLAPLCPLDQIRDTLSDQAGQGGGQVSQRSSLAWTVCNNQLAPEAAWHPFWFGLWIGRNHCGLFYQWPHLSTIQVVSCPAAHFCGLAVSPACLRDSSTMATCCKCSVWMMTSSR